MRIDILKKLLFSLIVKHCITHLDAELGESEVAQTIKKLVMLNRKLISFSTENAYWSNGAVIALLAIYDQTLSELGFSNLELQKLFPKTRPWPRMLSLFEHCLLTTGIQSRQKKRVGLTVLPKELEAKINDDGLIFDVIQKTLINLNSKSRADFVIRNDFSSRMLHQLNEPLNQSLNFKEYSPESSQEIFEFLLKLINNPDLSLLELDPKNRTVFHLAAELAPTFMLKLLQSLPEFALNIKNSVNQNLLHFAVKNDDDSNLEFLLSLPQATEIINETDNNKSTPLHHAARVATLAKVTLLVNAGSNLNCQDCSSNTGLHLVANRKWSFEEAPKIISYLLSNKTIKTELKNVDGLTAFELSYVKPVSYHNAHPFSQYYREKDKEHAFYQTELNSLGSFDLLLTCLREGRGIIFFREFIRKFPDVIVDYRGPQEENIVQVINQTRDNWPERSFIVQKLLSTLSEELPEILITRDQLGLTGIDHTLASFAWSCQNCNDYSRGLDWAILVNTDFFNYHTTPNQRDHNVFNFMALLSVFIYIVAAGSIMVDDGFSTKWTIISALILALAEAILLTWSNTSPRSRSELVTKLKSKINCLSNKSSEIYDEELAILPVPKRDTVAAIEAIEPIQLHPAGTAFRESTNDQDTRSVLINLEDYLLKSKSTLNSDQTKVLDKLLAELETYKQSINEPQKILQLLEETFDEEATSLFDESFNEKISNFYLAISEHTQSKPDYYHSRQMEYGTF